MVVGDTKWSRIPSICAPALFFWLLLWFWNVMMTNTTTTTTTMTMTRGVRGGRGKGQDVVYRRPVTSKGIVHGASKWIVVVALLVREMHAWVGRSCVCVCRLGRCVGLVGLHPRRSTNLDANGASHRTPCDVSRNWKGDGIGNSIVVKGRENLFRFLLESSLLEKVTFVRFTDVRVERIWAGSSD